MQKFLDDFKYLGYVALHPFDGFYEVRFRGRKNYYVATLLLIVYGMLNIVSYQYTGFVANTNPIFRMNSITTFLLALFPILLFIISNWSITAIFDGSGKIGDVYAVMCYSLFPKIIFDVIGIFLSNYIIVEELPILTAFQAIGTVWFLFLVFSGLCVVHEYSAARNIVVIVATFIAAVVIVFLAMLYISLIGKVVSFFITFFGELSKRW